MQIILFEDKLSQNLKPITLTRPSFDILCGGATLAELILSVFKPRGIHFVTRDYLKATVAAQHKVAKNLDRQLLFLNGAIAPDANSLLKFVKILGKKNFIIKAGPVILAAWVNGQNPVFKLGAIKNLKPETIEKFLLSLKLPVINYKFSYFSRLWDVIISNQAIIKNNASILSQGLEKYQPGVYVGKNVKIESPVYFDVAGGPIVLGDRTKIKAFSILRGPLVVGNNSVINSFSEIKGGSCLGHYCKVGGEVEASIIQSYSNKQHYGFLGHSYVGSWVNLGAGTTNSDLKNTYGIIKMQGIKTGRQFLGGVVGDYSKTAVGSLIFSGKVIGVNGFVYGRLTKDLPSFTNAVGKPGNWVTCPLVVALKAQQAMFLRRQIKVNKTHTQLLSAVFKQTEPDRRQAKVKSGKLNF